MDFDLEEVLKLLILAFCVVVMGAFVVCTVSDLLG